MVKRKLSREEVELIYESWIKNPKDPYVDIKEARGIVWKELYEEIKSIYITIVNYNPDKIYFNLRSCFPFFYELLHDEELYKKITLSYINSTEHPNRYEGKSINNIIKELERNKRILFIDRSSSLIPRSYHKICLALSSKIDELTIYLSEEGVKTYSKENIEDYFAIVSHILPYRKQVYKNILDSHLLRRYIKIIIGRKNIDKMPLSEYDLVCYNPCVNPEKFLVLNNKNFKLRVKEMHP